MVWEVVDSASGSRALPATATLTEFGFASGASPVKVKARSRGAPTLAGAERRLEPDLERADAAAAGHDAGRAALGADLEIGGVGDGVGDGPGAIVPDRHGAGLRRGLADHRVGEVRQRGGVTTARAGRRQRRSSEIASVPLVASELTVSVAERGPRAARCEGDVQSAVGAWRQRATAQPVTSKVAGSAAGAARERTALKLSGGGADVADALGSSALGLRPAARCRTALGRDGRDDQRLRARSGQRDSSGLRLRRCG